MDYKKIFLVLGIMIFSLFSVNAITTLNSCGKNSGWINNEVYYLNFSSVDVGYANNYCFYIPYGNYNNITIEQITPLITINKEVTTAYTNNRFMFFEIATGSSVANPTWINNSNFNNINLKIPYFSNKAQTDPKQFYFISYQTGSYLNIIRMYYNNFNNITIDGLNVFWHSYDSNADSNFQYNNLTNLNLKGQCFFVTGSTSYMGHYNIIKDSFLRLDVPISNCFVNINTYQRMYNTNFTNSVFISNNKTAYPIPYIFEPVSSGLLIQNSIIQGILLNDTNDDGLADTEIKTYMQNSRIYVDYTNYRFLQDYNEGKDVMSNTKIHLPINNGDIGSPTTLTIKNKLDASLIISNMTNAQAFRTTLTGSELNCGLFTSYKCNIINNPNTTSATGSYYLNYIDVGSVSKIKNTNISISHSGFGSVSASVIGNFDDFTLSDIEIVNNIVYSTGNILVGTNETLSRPFMKFKGNDFNINNNNFTYSFPTNVGVGEFLNIRTTNANNNLVTLNRFTNSVSTPLQKTEVGYYNLQTQFYNNYIGTNVILSSQTTTGIIPTKYVGFNHTDGYIYYYTIGNFYQENSGCTDANSDGFCDTSYTSGNVTDTKPLSSYPFVYTSHLLTYEDRVLNNGFNITLQYPTNNQTFTMSNSSGVISFGFSQNSDFQDLVCSFIIDGSNVFDTNYFVDKNLIYSINATTWTNGTHTYRVECGNQYQYVISNEITFNVNIVTGGGNGGGGNGGTGESPYTNNSINLINGNSISETANNVDNFVGDFTNGFMNLIIPVAIFIIFFLVIVIVLKFIGG